MTPGQFAHTLQLVDSFFPVGAFAYSDGLETATASGRVQDADSLASWIDHFLNHVFVPCEGLALLKCFNAVQREDWPAIERIDEELTALKPSAETRASSRAIGKRLLGTYGQLFENSSWFAVRDSLLQCNAPIAYGLVFEHRGLNGKDALLAFGYSRLAGIVSAGLRLMSMGQQQGQRVLTKSLSNLPNAVERIVAAEAEGEPLRSFSPSVDIQQMNHRYVYSRLFRS